MRLFWVIFKHCVLYHEVHIHYMHTRQATLQFTIW